MRAAERVEGLLGSYTKAKNFLQPAQEQKFGGNSFIFDQGSSGASYHGGLEGREER